MNGCGYPDPYDTFRHGRLWQQGGGLLSDYYPHGRQSGRPGWGGGGNAVDFTGRGGGEIGYGGTGQGEGDVLR